MFKKLAKKLKNDNYKLTDKKVSVPFAEQFLTQKNIFFTKLSKQAVEMYERKSDINKFSQLVLSNPENTSHNELMNDLFENGVVDPFEDFKLAQLADNEKFLKDLGLL